jgi:hypothetical protein
MKKRGQIEVQFNWVFILVAGALIFLFFFSIINWAKKNADQSSCIKIGQYLDSILTGSAVTKETVNQVNLPFKQLEFTCDTYRVDKCSAPNNLRNKIVFAPSRIEKGELVTWSLSWNVPFRVTNFLFVSSPQIRYIFIGDENNEIFQYLQDTFPEELGAEFNPGTIENLNNFKVRFIYVNEETNTADIDKLRRMANEDVTALKITTTTPIKISFYRKSLSGFSKITYSGIEFAGEASLFAAIFSDAPEEYDCNMQKAKQRLDKVAAIYKERSSDLASQYSTSGCGDYYGLAATALDDYLNGGTISSLYDVLLKQKLNTQRNSCPLIY